MHPFFSYSLWNHYFQYSWYNLELLRLLGAAPYGGCEVAEFLETISNLQPNDAESWQTQWLTLAERAQKLALEMQQSGHSHLSRNAFLRASNYFRCAQYLFPIMPESEQDHLLLLYKRSIQSFEKATALMDHAVHRVDIPFLLSPSNPAKPSQTANLPGWLHIPSAAQRLPNRKIPILICFGGADSTSEELYFMTVADGPALGYAVLTFDAPGQGLVLRRDQRLPLQPEGEVVLDSVLNFLTSFAASHPDAYLDLDAVAVTGQSLGGFFALRAAGDDRVKACVAVDAFYDMWDLAMARMPGWMVAPWENGYIGDWLIDWAARSHGKADIATRYQFAQAQLMFGKKSPCETLREMKRYTLKMKDGGSYLERVTCPVLVTGAAADPKSFLPELSTVRIMEGLRNVSEGKKELWVAEKYAEGGAQAKSGAWMLMQFRTFRFLDKVFEIERKGKAK